MLKVIKCGCEFNLPRSSIVKIDTTYDGVLITLRDTTEIRFSMQVTPQLKAIVPIIQTAKSDIVEFNLDAAMNGMFDKVINLTSKPRIVSVQQIIIPPNKVEDKENKTVQKKKGGRPKGSKTVKKS